MSKIRHVLALAALALGSQAATAGLIGDTVGIRYVGGGDTGVQTYVVGAGEEGNFFSNQFFDFTDTGFSIRSNSNFGGIFATGGQPVALELSSLDLGSAITGVSFSTNLSGVTFTFTGTSVRFQWTEQAIPAQVYLSADFNQGGGTVPEPATLALAGLALVGVAGARRKARSE